MFCLTQAASSHLDQVLQQASAPEGTSIRLTKDGGNLKLAFDKPQEEDTTLEHNGKTVLIVDPEIANALDNNTLDISQTPQGAQFVLK